MFGPAFLVAPVTVQGATTKQVYLPAGGDWFNFWTNQKLRGGRFYTVAAPIGAIPLFVRAGSIVPLGSPILDAYQPQKISSLHIYPGANAEFTLYKDNGKTTAYQHGVDQLTQLHWNNTTRQFSYTGTKPWTRANSPKVIVIKPMKGQS